MNNNLTCKDRISSSEIYLVNTHPEPVILIVDGITIAASAPALRVLELNQAEIIGNTLIWDSIGCVDNIEDEQERTSVDIKNPVNNAYLNGYLVYQGDSKYLLFITNHIKEKADSDIIPAHIRQLLLESAPVGVIISGYHGEVIYSNSLADNILGSSVHDLLKNDDIQSDLTIATRDAILSGRPIKNSIKEHTTKDSKTAWILAYAYQITMGEDRECWTCVILSDATESRQIREALQQSEERYKTIFEKTGLGICILSSSGEILECNHSFHEMLGYNIEALQGKTILDITHPEDIQRERIEINKLLEREINCYSSEKRFIARDGHQVWVKLIANGLRNIESLPSMVLYVANDITEKVEVEHRLEASEEQFRAIFDCAAIGIILTDINGSILLTNNAFQKMVGYTNAEILGNTTDHISHVDDISISNQVYEDLINKVEPKSRTFHKRFIHKSGGVIWTRASSSLIYDEDSAPWYVITVIEDITEKRETEEKLQEFNNFTETVLTNAGEGIVVYDTSLNVIMWNRFIERISGISEAEALGRNAIELLPHFKEHGISCLFDKVLNGESVIARDVPFYMPQTGKKGYVTSSYVPHCNYKGEIIGVIETVHDITSTKLAEKALLDVNNDLEKANRVQGEFLSNVTHEVRTPLTAVQGYTEMLLEGFAGSINNEQKQLLEKILSSSAHLIDIVNTVLELTRLKSGMLKVQPRICSAVKTAERAMSTVVPQAKKKGLKLSVQVTEEYHQGVYDEQKVIVILTNLLSNAVKFTEAGKIDVIIEKLTDAVCFTVIDTGMGMNDTDMDGIFNEFHQLSIPDKHKPSGFGLGLSIVSAMVDALNATMIVSSAVSIGSAFTVIIPDYKP